MQNEKGFQYSDIDANITIFILNIMNIKYKKEIIIIKIKLTNICLIN